MNDETISKDLGGDLLTSDYSEVHLLGGPWDMGVLALGKEFNAPNRIFCRPLFAIDSNGMLVYCIHSGFISLEPEDRSAPYNFAFASQPERDCNENIRVRYYYVYDKLLRWRATS